MDPLLLSIATAAAGTLAGEAAKGVVAAGRYVKDRFSKDPEKELAMLRAETGRVPVETLAAEIEAACAADPEFHRQLGELAGRTIEITQVNQAGQHVKFQNNFHGGAPKQVIQGDTINIDHLS